MYLLRYNLPDPADYRRGWRLYRGHASSARAHTQTQRFLYRSEKAKGKTSAEQNHHQTNDPRIKVTTSLLLNTQGMVDGKGLDGADFDD